MTRQDKIKKYNEVKELLFIFIENQKDFDWWLDGWWLFPLVAKTARCRVSLVKKVFFKDIRANHPEFTSYFEQKNT